MGGKRIGTTMQQNSDKKTGNPIVVFLAFFFGAVTALAVFWRMVASKGKKGTKMSDDAVDRDYEAADREMKQLISVLRRESERRMWGDPEIRISDDYGVRGTNPAYIQTEQVKPYRPRKRVSAKKIFARVVAVASAAAIVVTGLTMLPTDDMSTALAKESFGGIKQVVDEHNADNPFVILDIVPGMAYAVINDKRYDFSLGTIGYLAPGQLPIQQDLVNILTGADKEDFYAYAARKELIDQVIGDVADGYEGITYQEAYDGTGVDLKSGEWSMLFDSVEGKPTDGAVCPTGRLYARVEERPDSDAGTGDLPELEGYDYNLAPGSAFSGASVMSVSAADGIYTFAGGDAGDYEVIFKWSEIKRTSGYIVDELKSGHNKDGKLEGLEDMSDATGLYIKKDGVYKYVCTIGEFEGDLEETDTEKPKEIEADVIVPETVTDGTVTDETVTDETVTDETVTDETGTVENGEEGGDGTGTVETGGEGGDGTVTGGGDEPVIDETVTDGEGGDGGDGTGGGDGDETDEEDEPGTVIDEPVTDEEDEAVPVEQTFVPAALRTQPAPEKARTEDGWYLCVSTGDEDLEHFGDSEETAESEDEDSEETAESEDDTYYVLKFTYVEREEPESLYQVSEDREPRLISKENDDPKPYDGYVLEKGMQLSSLDTEEADTLDEDASVVGTFEYVGGGKGEYRLTAVSGMEKTAATTEEESPDIETQDTDSEDADSGDIDLQYSSARAAGSGSVYYLEVLNAPVYIKCTGTDKEDWLERYVFNSLNSQDNASDDFAIRVDTVLAGDLSLPEKIAEADLIYLEDGAGVYLEKAQKRYIDKEAGNVGSVDDLESVIWDISDAAIWSLMYAAVEESKPIIVDYGITTNKEDYPDSRYQNLAKVFLKKDLDAYYYEFNQTNNFVANILMNVNSDKFADKTDNDYHYVNHNVYIVNGDTPLVADDFPLEMDKDKAKAGFAEVLAAIRAENVMLPEDNRISEKISKAMAVQYIINYSLGVIGEYKDLSILELQPTANAKSDLHLNSNGDVLYWEKADQKEKGKQILRSSKKIETNVTLSSAAAFNTSHQDINEDYDMIFIGLDGQRFYHKEDKTEAVYNDSEKLNGKVYHTGDRVGDTRYDANDITKQKKEELLDYLRAGYPIVVENECFKDGSARKADAKDINTDRIADDTQMYAFLKEAISLHKANQTEDESESGIGLYTIEDVHSSAMFLMQLTARRPKIEILREKNSETDTGTSGGWQIYPTDQDEDTGMEVVSYDISYTEEISDKPGFTRGTIRYRIPNDTNYEWKLATHLYLDLNCDGIFTSEEEFDGYQYEQTADGGQISVDFNEIGFGYVPWKLEVTVLDSDDRENKHRRASAQGCFAIRGKDATKIRVLQILDDTENDNANLQKQYDKYNAEGDGNDFMLAHFIDGAAARGIEWDIKTIASGGKDGLEERLKNNENYLSLWDVVVLGFGESGKPGESVIAAVNNYIAAGGSVLVSSAGASSDRLGLSISDLGQSDQQTYGKLAQLAQNNGEKFRYNGSMSNMFEKTSGLKVDKINEGLITKLPYEIENTISLGDQTEVAAPDYLLDIGEEYIISEENNSEENKGIGQVYTTAWFTLFDTNKDRKGGYSISPRDGRNNYYVYSKGNVVYVGQSEYPYTYTSKDGGLPDGDGKEECKIFVNALLAAYNAGVHRANVSIVAGFNGVSKIESVTVPFDVAFKESKEAQGGILGETVDVYFRFTDNNIAFDKTTEVSLYYRKAQNIGDSGTDADKDSKDKSMSLLSPDGKIDEANYAIFTSQIWAVENNRLVEVTEGIVPDKVYRIKAPLAALQTGNDEMSEICVLLTNRYTRGGRIVETLSMDSISLNRAQMFLLE